MNPADIIAAWETEREQMAALIQAICAGLKPRAPNDYTHYNEWRLAEVAHDLISNEGVFLYYQEKAGSK